MVPLPQDEIDLTKEKLGLPDKKFYVPAEVIEHFRTRFSDLTNEAEKWSVRFGQLSKDSNFKNIIENTIVKKWFQVLRCQILIQVKHLLQEKPLEPF